MFKTKTITMDFKCENRPPPKADFTYKIGPDAIEIADTGRGRLSVSEDLEAVIRRLEYWHMGSLTGFKISCRDQNGTLHEVEWDGQRAVVSLADGAASKG
jgi:hypothetical protein